MPEEKIPRLVEGADIGSLDISAKDGFVQSCIDGVLNINDICDVTVLPAEEVAEAIERLISLGVVEWVHPKVSSAPPQSGLIEDVEIEEELQKQILDAFRQADRLNHYELLGVAMEADRNTIRRAYFKHSKTFHPDAYYGKRLGSFKPKMEVIFRKITDAYEAVGRPKKREAYDRYIKQSMAAAAVEQQMTRGEERAQAMSKALGRAPVAERHSHPVMAAASQEIPSTPAIPQSGPTFVPGSPEHQRMERRRKLLEQRLGRSGRPSTGRRPSSIPAPTERIGQKAALRDLTRSLKQTAVVTGGVNRSQRHLENARVAEAGGDLAAAANALRMAIALDSGSADLEDQYRRVNSNLRVQLLDIHRQQARYEEQNDMWAAASISWAKVVEAAPDDPVAPRQAAKAILAGGGDLRKARDYAQSSVELAPDVLDTRLLLARIYMEAGMDHSAVKELNEAAKLDPGHEMVKNLRKQLGG